MSRYPEYGARRALWLGPMGPVIVRVKTDDGLEGIGLGGGGNPGCFIVEQHLKRLLVGQDPRDTERLWDQMFRATLPYGRKGLPLMAISGVDNALWDIKGKAVDRPVYKLLGGATKPDIPVYATGNQSAVYKSLGFVGNKVAMPYGPWDGVEGMIYRDDSTTPEVVRGADLVGDVRHRVSGFQAESRHFMECIQAGTQPLTNFAEAAKTMRLVDQIAADVR